MRARVNGKGAPAEGVTPCGLSSDKSAGETCHQKEELERRVRVLMWQLTQAELLRRAWCRSCRGWLIQKSHSSMMAADHHSTESTRSSSSLRSLRSMKWVGQRFKSQNMNSKTLCSAYTLLTQILILWSITSFLSFFFFGQQFSGK